MKRTLTILSAALFAGALMVPAVHAQAPSAETSAAAPAAEATPTAKKHHGVKHHHHKKSTSSSATSTPTAPAGQ